MIENQREIFAKETQARKAEALRKRRNLKVHRIVCEHKTSGERRTIYLLGTDLENDIQSWRVQASLQHGKLIEQWELVEQTGEHCQIQFVPPSVRQTLCMEWVKDLTHEQKTKVLDFIKQG